MSREENELGDSFDNTHEISIDIIKQRAIKGVTVFVGRGFFLQILALVASIYLGIFLSPQEFGVFFIVSAVVNFLSYFSDVGLAAALIQKKSKITNVDLKTTFTVQQLLVLTLISIVLVFLPHIRNYYQLSSEATILLYALLASFFLSSLKTIPSVLLERELEFTKFVIPQIAENVLYHLVTVILAWQGFGVMAFTYAVLTRSIVGLVVIYGIRPWKPGFSLSKKSLQNLLQYGVPYQVNSFLATIKDDGLTAFLGGILSPIGMGYLGWAQKWAKYPLRIFMDVVLKVTFPAFSRMQDDKKHLESSVTRSIFFICFLTFPSLIGFILLAPMIIEIIPRYEKWEVALVPLYIIGIDTLFAASTTQITNLLNAIGKIKLTFKFMVMWTVLAWLFIPYLAYNYGVNGAALGYALVSSSSVIPLYIAKQYVNFSLKDAIGKPLFSTIVMGAVVYMVRDLFSSTFISLVIVSSIGLVVYIIASRLIIGESLDEDFKKIKTNLVKF